MPCPCCRKDKFNVRGKGTRGEPRAVQGGGKPPHSKMGWVWMIGTSAKNPIVSRVRGAQLKLAAAGATPTTMSAEMLTPWRAGAQPFDSAPPNLRMNRPAGRFTSSAPTEYLRAWLGVSGRVMLCPYCCKDKFNVGGKGTRGEPRAAQGGGKPPHSKMGWVWMWGASVDD